MFGLMLKRAAPQKNLSKLCAFSAFTFQMLEWRADNGGSFLTFPYCLNFILENNWVSDYLLLSTQTSDLYSNEKYRTDKKKKNQHFFHPPE